VEVFLNVAEFSSFSMENGMENGPFLVE